jgi:hypothetical protein
MTGKIKPSLVGMDVGYITDPSGIRLEYLKLLIQ